MIKTRKVTNDEVKYILSIPTYITERSDAKKMKYTLLDTMTNQLGDEWYGLKDKTKQVLDYICFLAVDRGHFFAKPETIAKEHDVSKSAVYALLKLLRERGSLVKVNRTSRKQNGLGSAIYIVVDHPYFGHITDYLKMDWNTDRKADWKAETDETACGSKDEQVYNSSTYSSLPTFSSKPRTITNHSTVRGDTEIGKIAVVDNYEKGNQETGKQVQKWVKYVPRVINSLFARTLGDKLLPIWRKVKLAEKAVHSKGNRDKDLVETRGVLILRNLLKNTRFKDMTADEMCAYVYTSMRNSLLQDMGEEMKGDMVFDGEDTYYVTEDGEKVHTESRSTYYSEGHKNPLLNDILHYMKTGAVVPKNVEKPTGTDERNDEPFAYLGNYGEVCYLTY